MGLRIFGLPDTLPVPGSNHLAFVADTEEEMKRRDEAIPTSGVHILVSLCPWREELERFPPQVSTSLCPTPLLGGSETQAVPGNTADQKDSATLSSELTTLRISGHLDMFTKAEAAFSGQKEPILWWWMRLRFWGQVKLWDRRSWSTFVKKQKHLASWYDLVPACVALHVKLWWNLRNLVNFMGTSVHVHWSPNMFWI